jgi:hypothetical protein
MDDFSYIRLKFFSFPFVKNPGKNLERFAAALEL